MASAIARHSRAGGLRISLAFDLYGLKSKSFHSSCGRAGNFSLLVQRKVTKRNTPQSIAPAAHPARRVRASGRVPLTAHPCAGSGIGAIRRAAPCGAFPTAVAAMQWGPGKARAARSCAQKQEQTQKRRASLLLTWLLILHPLHRTEHRRRRRGKGAYVRAQGCASSRRPAGAEKRRALSHSESAVSGAASFAYFSSLLKKSKPLAAGEWKPLLPNAEDQQQSRKIPACAGLRRQDVEANIRAANGPKGELRMQRATPSGREGAQAQ
ncbi:hypothetical protein [Rudaea sp.]|uniref:hypothetical protein n=1 Tax=Rudaea sp. TaxID=2136325 RepID=UPI00321F693B